MKKYILLFLLTFILIPLTPQAKERITFGDVLDELAELERQKAEKDNEIQMSQAEYDRTTREIYNIEKEIENLSAQIQQANEDIKNLEKEIEEKKEETDNILVFLQLSNGEKSYLEYIFKAKSFTDFIHRVSIVEQLGKYNKEQIKEMNDLIKKNNELKEKNAKRIEDQKVKKAESKVKKSQLGSRINELVQDGIPIEEEINEKKEEIQLMRDSGCKNRSDKLAVCYPLLTATGFLRPLESGRITSEFSWRISPITGKVEVHSGIDIGVSEGTPVYPAAAGKIAYFTETSCGGKRVYIYHNVKGKQYTTVYMHLLSYGKFKKGDTVTANDIIGYSGGESTKASKGGIDKCTTAGHLHFTVAEGHTLNHRSTMINPREVVEFPALRGRFKTRYF